MAKRKQQSKSASSAFRVEQRGDRFYCLGPNNSELANFSTEVEASHYVNAYREIYEILAKDIGAPVAPGHGKETAERLSPGRLEHIGRLAADAARQFVEQHQAPLKVAGKSRAAATETPPGASALTEDDLRRVLRQEQDKPKRGGSRAGSTKAPKVSQVVAKIQGEKQRKRRGAAKQASQPGTSPVASQGPQTGGFVLEDPSAGLSAHDLTRMLSQAPKGFPEPSAPTIAAARTGGQRPSRAAAVAKALSSKAPIPVATAAGQQTQQASTGGRDSAQESAKTISEAILSLFGRIASMLSAKLSLRGGQRATTTAAPSSQAPGLVPNVVRGVLPSQQAVGGFRSHLSRFRASPALGRIGSFFARGATGQAAGSTAVGAAGAASGGGIALAALAPRLAALAGPIGIVGGGLAALGISLLKAPFAIQEFSSSLLEGQRSFARFNGSLANTFAALDRQQLMLNARQAGTTAGSTKRLSESTMALKESILPLQTLMQNMKNDTFAKLAKLGTKIADTTVQIAEFLGILVKDEKDKKPVQHPTINFLDDVIKNRWARPKNQPPAKKP